jgi:uncharacterized protein
MSEEDVERTQKAFRAYVRGDFDEVLAILDPDIVYRSAQEAPVQGREAVRAAWERWEASWDEVEMTSEEIIDAGDRQLQVILFRGRGRGSGVKVEARFYEVYTVRDGRTVRWEEFSDRAEALEAAGLSE